MSSPHPGARLLPRPRVARAGPSGAGGEPPAATNCPTAGASSGRPDTTGEVITAYLAGRTPDVPAHSVCFECKRRGTVCVTVAHGTPCLGPVTHAGCGALCPRTGGAATAASARRTRPTSPPSSRCCAATAWTPWTWCGCCARSTPPPRNSRRLHGSGAHPTDTELTALCERVIRNHDPCISCSTHFLDLTVVRT